jgi:prolyl 4-hydroxylase
LISHRDKLKTHIISAIINVDQVVDEDWPLIIEDNYYRKHHVFLNPGEVIFYESARLDHGRPLPLKGNKFANIFCHFMPVNMEKN